MSKLVRLFISARQQMIISILLGMLFFFVLVLVTALFADHEARRIMANRSQPLLQPFMDRAERAVETFSALRTDVTATPCSPEFYRQLRRVAYRPDGFNEFFYAPRGVVECSAGIGRLDPPIDLGQPDMAEHDGEPAMWVDRGLAFAGMNGLVGSVLHMNPFAIVVPLEKVRMSPPEWMNMEIVLVAPSGRWWHRAGQPGVYARYKASLHRSEGGLGATLHSSSCLPSGHLCVVAEAPILSILNHGKIYVAATLIASAALAAWLARMAQAFVVNHWSFESRFRRHIDANSLICVYQPIMELQTGMISGCEVLARWRDVDDTVIYPDRFIPLVEQFGLTRKFTKMVVEKALADLSAWIPADQKLTVTFNVFPRDFDSAALLELFTLPDSLAGRFDIVVEIVESNAIEVAAAQQQIEVLRAAGIRTYIDDFGTGYSNIHNLGALSVDGVKLDRSFAMAAEGSVMSRMLGFAIEMVHASGRAIIVEGVETAERLHQLKGLVPPIEYVQGYFISRPLEAEAFSIFLQRHEKGFRRLELVA